MRTIEGIVASHRAATELRNAGKPIWSRTIHLNPIINQGRNDRSEANCAKMGNEIAALLRSSLPKAELDWDNTSADTGLIEIVEGMESLTETSYADCDDYSVREDMKNMLHGLYDWADRNRVWLG